MKGLFKLLPFDFFKGALVSVFVAILTYAQQILDNGEKVNINLILTTSITSLIGYLIKQLLTDNNGAVLSMIGGRKKRKKKPTSFANNNSFEFEGNDFNLATISTYTSDIISEQPISVVSFYNALNSQTVTFSEPIQFTDFESLYFEIEVD